VSAGAPLPVSPFRNDPPVAIVNGEQGDIMLLTRWGEAVRFPQRTIDVKGSVATTLDPDDRFVAAVALPKDTTVLIITTSGQATRYDTAKLKALAKPGAKSKRIFLARDVMAMLPCSPQSQLLYLTYSGKLFFMPTVEIPLQARSGKGTQLHDTQNDPILAATLISKDWL
jgi:DNA gyrase/topoisomerase IV subunit A